MYFLEVFPNNDEIFGKLQENEECVIGIGDCETIGYNNFCCIMYLYNINIYRYC